MQLSIPPACGGVCGIACRYGVQSHIHGTFGKACAVPYLVFGVYGAYRCRRRYRCVYHVRKEKIYLGGARNCGREPVYWRYRAAFFVICPVVLVYGLSDYLFFTSALTKIQEENNENSIAGAMGFILL